MKIFFFYLFVLASLSIGTTFTRCTSPNQKVDDAKANVEQAEKELWEAQKVANSEVQRAVYDGEWKAFKSTTDVRIKENEARIIELRARMKTSGKTLDALYAKKIAMLEQKNSDMKAKVETYDKGRNGWESFKLEFNTDMTELGAALQDLAIDDKK